MVTAAEIALQHPTQRYQNVAVTLLAVQNNLSVVCVDRQPQCPASKTSQEPLSRSRLPAISGR
jgi:hypothetical protein